jgi:hypothetical protein
MAVRNFYLEADVEGRKTKLRGGPARKDGSMTVTLTQRDEGSIKDTVEIICLTRADGTLMTTVHQIGPKPGERRLLTTILTRR